MREGRRAGISRRDFTKLSAAAGFAILSGMAQGAKTNSDTIRVGILGCGHRGTNATRQMLMGNDNVKVIAMADLFEDRLKESRDMIRDDKDPKISSKYAVDDGHCFIGVDAYKEILETDIDVVVEGTLPYARPKHIEAAVNAKKHVFAEKPVAVEPEGVRRVMAAADKARELGLTIVAGTQRRHQKDYVETIKKIQDGAIGQIKALRAYWCGDLPFVRDRRPEWSDLEYRIRNWYSYCWVAGDSIVEQHVHNLDVCNWVMGGPPIRAFAMGGRAWKPREERYGDIYDHFACDFEYENGVHMMSFCRHWNGFDETVFEEIVGTKGTSNGLDMADAGEDPYVQEHIDLIKSIRGTGPYLNEGRQVAESTMTAIMGRMAAYTGQTQVWNKALNTDLKLVPEELDFGKAYPCGPVPSPGK